jgi:hypothetical protein
MVGTEPKVTFTRLRVQFIRSHQRRSKFVITERNHTGHRKPTLLRDKRAVHMPAVVETMLARSRKIWMNA